MRRPALGAGFTMAAMLGVSLATTSMLALAGEPSAGPPPAAEAPASGPPTATPPPAAGAPGGAAPGAAGAGAAPAGGPMLGPATLPLEFVASRCRPSAHHQDQRRPLEDHRLHPVGEPELA